MELSSPNPDVVPEIVSSVWGESRENTRGESACWATLDLSSEATGRRVKGWPPRRWKWTPEAVKMPSK